ncbi:hypothetical protein [Halorarum halobium]|nr:hypothetical protein [Halobaculum sp. XH14]
MHHHVVRTDRSAFERVRDAILNRGDPDEDDDPTGPRVPTGG